MKNKIIMVIEFIVAFALMGVGVSISFDNIFQNLFFGFLGLIVLILAAYRLDNVLGNGPFNNKPTADKENTEEPPQEETKED